MSTPPADPERPALFIIAGPNGSGKSSAYKNVKLAWQDRDIWINNPDLLTARLQVSESLPKGDANLQAVKRIESWLYSSVDVHQTIGVETVLSTDKYRKLVEHARRRGFLIVLIYVVLDSPELNVERVKIRAAEGGHDVPIEKIHQRYWRSLEQFPWFLKNADRAWVYNNSGSALRLMAVKEGPTISFEEGALEVIKAAIKTIQTN
jgi:predicted ABC-type ATPase